MLLSGMFRSPAASAAIAGLALTLLFLSGSSQAEPALLVNVDLEPAPVVEPVVESLTDAADEHSAELHQVLPDPIAPHTVEVTLYNENTRETLSATLPLSAQYLSDETASHFRDFLRCHTSGRRHAINRRVISIIADLGRQYPGHVIEVVSGYRRPGLGAPKSRHFRGRAIDLRVRGVKTKEVRDYVWAAHEKIGLGHYHGDNFLHIDHRPSTKKIGWDQRRKKAKYRYHPYWTNQTDEKAVAAKLW